VTTVERIVEILLTAHQRAEQIRQELAGLADDARTAERWGSEPTLWSESWSHLF
jgi:hypothetical protein